MIKSKKTNTTSSQAGFTLVELILYIGLVSLFLTAIISFAWNVIYGRSKSDIQLEVNQNARLIVDRISYEIRQASDTNSVSGSTLSLANSDLNRNPTIFTLSGGKVLLTQGSGSSCPDTDPCELNTDQIEVTALTFTDLSTPESKNVKFEISLEYTNPDNNPDWDQSLNYTSSVNLRN